MQNLRLSPLTSWKPLVLQIFKSFFSSIHGFTFTLYREEGIGCRWYFERLGIRIPLFLHCRRHRRFHFLNSWQSRYLFINLRCRNIFFFTPATRNMHIVSGVRVKMKTHQKTQQPIRLISKARLRETNLLQDDEGLYYCWLTSSGEPPKGQPPKKRRPHYLTAWLKILQKTKLKMIDVEWIGR